MEPVNSEERTGLICSLLQYKRAKWYTGTDASICTTQVWRTCYLHCTMYNRFNVFCTLTWKVWDKCYTPQFQSEVKHCAIDHSSPLHILTEWSLNQHNFLCKFSKVCGIADILLRPSITHSQVVTHPSTNPDQCCLTSVIRWEPVHSAWYGRRTLNAFTRDHLYENNVKMIYTFVRRKLYIYINEILQLEHLTV